MTGNDKAKDTIHQFNTQTTWWLNRALLAIRIHNHAESPFLETMRQTYTPGALPVIVLATAQRMIGRGTRFIDRATIV